MSDVSALMCLLLHIWIAPLSVGAVVRSLYGPLPHLVVVLIIEVSRFGLLTAMGALNASYMVQLVTIMDSAWIHQFRDRTVILASAAFSILLYFPYIPELVMVSTYRCKKYHFHMVLSETSRDNSISNKRSHGTLLWWTWCCVGEI